MSERAARIIVALIGFVIGGALTQFYNWQTDPRLTTSGNAVEISREVYVDTVTYRKPIPVDSTVVRYITATLPTAKVDTFQAKVDTSQTKIDTLQVDSVAVEIPITQTEYADTTYRAWVSGYRAQLDSIQVFTRTEIVTLMQKKPPKRWGIGIQAGYGFTPKNGLQPYVGIGISWNICNF